MAKYLLPGESEYFKPTLHRTEEAKKKRWRARLNKCTWALPGFLIEGFEIISVKVFGNRVNWKVIVRNPKTDPAFIIEKEQGDYQ